MKHKLLAILALVLIASVLTVSAVYGQGGTGRQVSDDDVNRIAKQLYCPVCPNTPLDVCETKACQDWRAQIRDQLEAGWSDQQVIDYFVAQYGERVLAEPKRGGFTSFVWLLPVLALALGAAIVAQVIRGWRAGRQAAPATAPPVPAVSRAQVERIEAELRDLR